MRSDDPFRYNLPIPMSAYTMLDAQGRIKHDPQAPTPRAKGGSASHIAHIRRQMIRRGSSPEAVDRFLANVQKPGEG